jgi:hypothetical protein
MGEVYDMLTRRGEIHRAIEQQILNLSEQVWDRFMPIEEEYLLDIEPEDEAEELHPNLWCDGEMVDTYHFMQI